MKKTLVHIDSTIVSHGRGGKTGSLPDPLMKSRLRGQRRRCNTNLFYHFDLR